MAVELRPFETLGKFRIDWLNASQHFSFGHYYDPSRMGVGPLRVWNDDEIQPHTGFDPHPQGSRMSVADDELEHVVVVPGGLLAPAA
jgi:hypothetical protein